MNTTAIFAEILIIGPVAIIALGAALVTSAAAIAPIAGECMKRGLAADQIRGESRYEGYVF